MVNPKVLRDVLKARAQHPELRAADLIAWVVLDSFNGEGKGCFGRKREQICEYMKCGERAFVGAVGRLKAQGFLDVHVGGGRGNRSAYTTKAGTNVPGIKDVNQAQACTVSGGNREQACKKPGTNGHAPSILKRTQKGGEPPAYLVDLARKLLRGTPGPALAAWLETYPLAFIEHKLRDLAARNGGPKGRAYLEKILAEDFPAWKPQPELTPLAELPVSW
jgi:hypothetical protein